MEYIKDYFRKYTAGLNKLDLNKIEEVVKILFRAWQHDNKVFIIGNGGSASTASHMACDLGKGTLENHYDRNLRRLNVISLTDNVAHITAIGNDLGYENIFAQQLQNLAKHGDILISITGSGNSPNIIKAVKCGNDLGMITIGLLGFNGGLLKDLVDHHIIFEENHYGRVEDFHLMVDHIITERLSLLLREHV